ncbi:hypothetical protein EJ04DRAFT_522163 [Polyplosphaeria fusca]|uniref:Uncharacterized protein n=1 Tax=Polyplosphaeria fusca TaxID=682080 RepID=A0A9P4R4B0_9PLEO|nr:hypothetical protein EJ04DRAFT_522163 [Polyplosphaeria fusca]
MAASRLGQACLCLCFWDCFATQREPTATTHTSGLELVPVRTRRIGRQALIVVHGDGLTATDLATSNSYYGIALRLDTINAWAPALIGTGINAVLATIFWYISRRDHRRARHRSRYEHRQVCAAPGASTQRAGPVLRGHGEHRSAAQTLAQGASLRAERSEGDVPMVAMPGPVVTRGAVDDNDIPRRSMVLAHPSQPAGRLEEV